MDELNLINWGTLIYYLSPVMVLSLTALMVMVCDLCKQSPLIQTGIAMAGVVLALCMAGMLAGMGPIAAALMAFDHLTWIGTLSVLAVTFLTVMVSMSYAPARLLPQGEFLTLMLLAVASMLLLLSTTHLLVIFVAIEGMSIAAYVLAAFQRRDSRSVEAGLKYFLNGAVASAFLVFGIAFIYGATGGTLELTRMIGQIAQQMPLQSVYLVIGMASLITGLGFKISAVPFHFWAPDVYEGAPLPVTMFFATGVKIVTFILLFRVAFHLGIVWGVRWENLTMGLSIATMTIGNLAALAQSNMKRMLSYSSIAHVGYAFIALVLVTRLHYAVSTPLLFYMIGYSVMTIGAFTVLIAMSGGTEERTDLADAAGLGARHPALAALYSLFLLSLAGLPPTVGFFAKYYLFSMAVSEGYVWLVVVAVINSVISVAYYVRPIMEMYFKLPARGGVVPTKSESAVAISVPIKLTLALMAAAVLALGLFPSVLLNFLGQIK